MSDRFRRSIVPPPEAPSRGAAIIGGVGDANIDAARSAAADADANATALHDAAAAQLAGDVADYNEAIAVWDRVKGQMSQADFDACFAALTQAATSVGTESNQVAASLGYITSGDNKFNAAQLMNDNPPGPKIMAFNDAKNTYNAAPPCVTTANNAHAAFVTALATANGILSHYG